jgi:predicted enzyme related to lactoylglutathione lyase
VSHRIVHMEIPAEDPQRASKFYGSLFGWEFKDSGMPGVEYWMTETSNGEPGSTGLGLMRRMAPGQQFVTYIDVDSVDSYTARAQKLGAEVVTPKMEVPGHGYLAHLKDPEGNVFAIWEGIEHNGNGS